MIHSQLRLRKIDNKNFVVAVGEKSETFKNTVKLNDTAAEIFSMLQQNKSAEDIAKKFGTEYGISYETALSDIKTVISQFEKAGFFQ